MISPDKQPTCIEISKTGYQALYDITEDVSIGEGVILVATIMGETYLFQLAKTTNVFLESTLGYISGSEAEFLEDPPFHIPINYIPIRLVRYPTKKELEWYNKQDLI